jgi:acetyl-CoA carboxylase biotin carboxyl carrier protein
MSNEKLDTQVVRELAELLKETDLSEIECEVGAVKIRVTRSIAPVVQQAVVAPSAAAPVSAAPIGGVESAPAPAVAIDAVKAPMVGTVYMAPEPGAAPFVKVGDTIKEGDTLLLIEAMKTFNPVRANKSGVIKDILVADGKPVEYDEPLVVIG